METEICLRKQAGQCALRGMVTNTVVKTKGACGSN